MAMDNTVDVNIVAKVDASATKKEFEQIAQNSKTAVERSFKNLELMMKKSMESIGKNAVPVIDDSFLGGLMEKVVELNEQISNTGNLPKSMTSNMYKAEQQLMGIMNKWRELNAYANTFTEKMQMTETPAFTKLSAQMKETRDNMQSVNNTMSRLNREMVLLQEREELLAQVKGGQKALDNYNKRIEAIKKYEDEIIKLKELTGTDLEGKRNRGMMQGFKTITDDKGAQYKVGGELEKTRARIAELEEKIKNAKQAFNTFGSDAIQKLSKIREIEASIDPSNIAVGVEGINAQLLEEERILKELNTRYSELKAKRGAMPTAQKYQESDEWRKVNDELTKTEAELVAAATRVNEMTDKIYGIKAGVEETTLSMSAMRNAVWSVSRVLGNVYTIGLDFARTAKQIANIYKTIWNYGKKLLSVFKKLKDTIRGTAKDHAKSWKQMLRDVFRYAFGIRSLFMLFRRLRGYIKEAFEEMAKQVPEVNKTLSELKSSLGMLKGSLATAFEPILSFIAPALNLLIEKLAKVMTYIGMFFAALTGRGYVYKATKTVQTFADSVKELNKQLQGFDEINNLTTNKDNGANDTPMAKFEKVPVPDWIQKIADYLKDLLHKFIDPIKKAWARIGPYVVAAWRRAFYNVKALLMDIVDDFMKAWSEKGQDIAEHFLEIAGDVGNIIANIAEALRTAWNYEDNGYKIWKAILEIIDKILVGVRKITIDMVQWTHNINLTPAMTAFREWLESLVPITEMVMNILYDFWHDALKPILTWAFDGENSGIARLFRIFKDFNDKLDTEKIRENLDKVWQALGRFGQTVGEGLLIFLDRMSTRIADFANGDKFESICDKIVAFLDEIKPEDVADDLEQLVDIVGNLAKQVWDAIKFVLDHKDEILDMIEWISEHLKGIISAMISFKTVIDFARLAANIYLMVTAFQKLQGAGGVAGLLTKLKEGGGFISKIIGLLGGLSSTVWIVIGVVGALIALFVVLYNKSEDFRAGVDKGLQTIKDAFSNFMEHLKPSIDVLKESLAPVFEVIKAIGAYLIEHLPQILGFIGDVVGAVLSLVGYAVRFIGDAINVIVSFITGVIALLMGDLDGFFKSGDNMIRSFVDGVLSFLSFALGVDLTGLVDSTIATISRAFQRLGDGIIDIFKWVKNGITNIINGIKQFFANVINWIIEKINWAAKKLNELKNSKGLSTVISIAGGSPALNAIQQTSQTRSAVRSIPNSIPGLAKGAVIPPNNEFLALLGDQKSGTNIETPLDTMIEAFNMAGGNTSQEELQLMREQNELLRGILENCGITDKQIFRSVQRSVVDYQKQTGKTAFA